MKKRRRLWPLTLAILFLFVALLPRLLSSSSGERQIMKFANRAAPGSLEVENLTLRWWGHQLIQGIVYTDGDQGLDARVEEVRLEKGLLPLLFSLKNPGQLEVVKPHVVVTAKAPAEPVTAEDPSGEKGEEPSAGEKKKAAEEKKSSEPISIPQLTLKFALHDGVIKLILPDAPDREVVVADQLNVLLDMQGTKSPLAFNLDFNAGDGEGRASVKGTVQFPEGKRVDLNEVAVDLSVDLTSLDLKPLSQVAAPFSGGLLAGGILNIQTRINGTARKGLEVKTNLRLAGLEMKGGPLGKDAPQLGDLAAVVDARWLETTLVLSNLTVRSDLITFSAEGQVGQEADGTLSAKAVVDLARLCGAFPHTLKLRDGLAITQGKMVVQADVKSEGERQQLDGRVTLQDVQGKVDGNIVAWTEPTDVAVKGSVAAGMVRIDSLKIDSPFMTAEGGGTLEDLTFKVRAELSKTMQEVGKFVDTGGWDALGTLAIDLALKQSEKGIHVARTGLRIDSFSLAKGASILIPSSVVEANLQAQVHLDESHTLQRIEKPTVTWQSWPSKGRLMVSSVAFQENQKLPRLTGIVVDANLDLEKVGQLLLGLGSLPEDMKLIGEVKLQAEAAMLEEVLTVEAFDVTASALKVTQADKVLFKDSIVVKGRCLADTTSRHLSVSSLECVLSAGSIALTDMNVEDWGQKPPSLDVKGKVSLSLEPLLVALGDGVTLPPQSAVGGQLAGTWMVASKDGGQRAECNLAVSDFKLTQEGETLLSEKEITLGLQVATRDASVFSVEQFRLVSKPIGLGVTASYTKEEATERLKADGRLTLDLVQVADYVKAFSGIEIIMEGKDDQPFSMTSSWTTGEKGGAMQGAQVDAGFKAERIKAFGLDVTQLNVPLVITQGVVMVQVLADVNSGKLNISPMVDTRGEEAFLSFPDQAQILKDVQITDEVANDLLALLHPVFGRASNVSGIMDLSMANFYWPLDPARKNAAQFSGRLELREVKLGSSGMLEKLLAAMKVKERQVDVGTRDIQFTCKNGRIECSPVKLKIDGHQVVLAGTVGLDQTLDYAAQVPVTERLVGDMYKYLEGTTISVPISGTASEPRLDENFLAKSVSDLVRQAAKKALQDKAGEQLKKLFQ